MSDQQHDTPSPDTPANPNTPPAPPAWQTPAPANGTQWDALPKAEPRKPTPLRPEEPEQVERDVDAEAGLARMDPLALRPRTSSIVLCAVFAVMFALVAAAAYWLGVRTVDGQSFEDIAIMNYADGIPGWLGMAGLSSMFVIVSSLVLGALAFLVAGLRRRWWLMGQLAAFCLLAFAAGRTLKPLLPRPLLVHVNSSSLNSAPSGHTLLAAAAGLALLCAVPHAWRALFSVVSTLFTIYIGCSVVVDKWHRPADVVMAVFVAGALMMATLAFTRKSGMDRPGRRVSSPSVQIVATCLITFGVCAFAYAAYLIWQVSPGLAMASGWTVNGATGATTAMIAGAACLVNGMVLMMRQLTAAPLTRLGLIGAPPAPPSRTMSTA
ncbi:MAG: phosphatase PAP2 family protein [Bifidobacterium sp.]|nr:phosphatase PAP2 family protein [Bifidobacterium sp.]